MLIASKMFQSFRRLQLLRRLLRLQPCKPPKQTANFQRLMVDGQTLIWDAPDAADAILKSGSFSAPTTTSALSVFIDSLNATNKPNSIAPLEVQIYKNKVVRVATQGLEVQQAAPTKSSIAAATLTGDSARLGDGPIPAVVPSIDVSNPTTAPVPVLTPVQAPTLPDERLTIQAGQRLSFAVGAWLKSQNIELSWEPAGTLPGRVRDVVIDSAWRASQPALEPTLSEVLAPFGLTAHVLRQGITTGSTSSTGSTSIVVRNTSNSQP